VRPLPTVSVGLPVYNGETYLEEAIDSILAQTYDDFELVVSDNASTDRTREIVLDYRERDPRVRAVFHETNRGPMKNFNGVVPLSRGRYFKWAADDDVLAPTFLERCVPILEEDPDVVLAHGRTVIIDEGDVVREGEAGRPTDAPDVVARVRALLFEASCHPIFGLIRRGALLRLPPMGAYAHGDGVLLLRLGLLGRFHEVPEVLLRYRHHPGQSIELARSSYRDYSRWFDPGNEGKVFLPFWRRGWEFATSLARGPLSIGERVRAFAALAGWARRFRPELQKDVAHWFRRRVAGERPPAEADVTAPTP